MGPRSHSQEVVEQGSELGLPTPGTRSVCTLLQSLSSLALSGESTSPNSRARGQITTK